MNVILLMAMTVDGKTAKTSDHLVNWTSSEDKNYFIQTTKKSGVVIMGSKTYCTLDYPLPDRLNIVMTRSFRQSTIPNVEFTNKNPIDLILDLKLNRGYNDICLIGGQTINNLFIKHNLISEVHVTVVPKLFGTGLGLFSESLDVNLDLRSVKQLGTDLLLIYKVKGN